MKELQEIRDALKFYAKIEESNIEYLRGNPSFKENDYSRLALNALTKLDALTKRLEDDLDELDRWRKSHHEEGSDYNPDYCAARDALKEHLKYCQEWKPIDTAPKDGTEILLYWAREARRNGVGSIVICAWDGEDWVDEDGYSFWDPTHWMPLPTPPNEGE